MTRPPAPGLTQDPAETGVLHDAYFRSEGGPWYLSEEELRAVKRRMGKRGTNGAAPDLEAIRRDIFPRTGRRSA